MEILQCEGCPVPGTEDDFVDGYCADCLARKSADAEGSGEDDDLTLDPDEVLKLAEEDEVYEDDDVAHLLNGDGPRGSLAA